jgi:DNA-binding NtrC family response regulator
VRELRNAVTRTLSLELGTTDDGSPAPVAAASSGPGPVDLSLPLLRARDQLLERFERAYLTEALRVTGGNVTRAAELAQVTRKFIHRAINRYRLRGDRERRGPPRAPRGP